MKITKLVLLLASAMIITPHIDAATVNLTQGGWDIGGPLSITFTGDDLNSNGGIDTDELTAFNALFNLPSGGTAAFSLPDLGNDGFFFGSVTDYFIKADGPDYSLYDTTVPGGSIAFVADSLGTFIAISGESLQQVPEPGTTGLLGLALAGVFLVKLRR
jgi:PEP-CTERM motif